MMTRRKSALRALAMGLAVWGMSTLGAEARAELITNGGFEQPTGSVVVTTANTPAIPGWTVTAGSVDIVRQSQPVVPGTIFFPAFEGIQTLDVDGLAAATIQQVISTVIGTSYQLTFAYANNPDGTSASANVSVLGAAPLLSTNITHSGSAHGTIATMNYTLFSAFFTATSTSTTVRFTSSDPPASAFGIIIDAVSVNALVPEPSSVVLTSLGCVGLVGYGWRRRRTSAAA